MPIQQIYAYDLSTGTVAEAVLGAGSASPDDTVLNPALSHDGNWLLFRSAATNLGTLTGYGAAPSLPSGWYLRNLSTGAVVAVPTPSGTGPFYATSEASLSGDGRWVAVQVNRTVATSVCSSGLINDLYVYDRDTDEDGAFDESGQTGFTIETWSDADRTMACGEYTMNLSAGNGPALGFYASANSIGLLHTVALRARTIPPSPPVGQTLGLNAAAASQMAKNSPTGGGTPCTKPTANNPTSLQGDPVNTATGAFVASAVDITCAGTGVPFSMSRIYNSNDTISGEMGPGWVHPFESTVTLLGSTATVRMPSSQQVQFTQAGSSWVPAAGVHATLTGSTSTGWTLTTKDQTAHAYDANGRLASIKDRNSQGLTVTRNGSGQVTTVTTADGRSATFAYTSGLLTGVTMSDSRTVSYGYTSGRLTSATDPDGAVTDYTYSTAGLLDTITDGDDRLVVDNTYDTSGRVTAQADANGNGGTFTYNSGSTVYTDAEGHDWTDFYEGLALVAQSDPLGNTTRYRYGANGEVVRVVRPNDTWSGLVYDERGNITEVRRPDGTREQTAWNTRNDPTSHTNAEGEVTGYGYNSAGNLTSVTDPAGTTTIGRDSAGRVTSITDATSRATTFTYDTNGDLVTITAADGGVTTRTYDGAGRMLTQVSPLGNATGGVPADHTTTWTWSPGGDSLTVTTPEGRTTTNTWSDAGLIVEVEDASGRATTFTYDDAGHLVSVAAPGAGTKTYSYDEIYNRTSYTDANGHTTTYTYDAAGRLLGEEDARAASGRTPTTLWAGWPPSPTLGVTPRPPSAIGPQPSTTTTWDAWRRWTTPTRRPRT